MCEVKACWICDGIHIEKTKEDFYTIFDGKELVVPSVPTYKCMNCGENYYNKESSVLIEKVILEKENERQC